MAYMIGVDVGGTFTDFSVFNQETGELFNYKDSSTPADPSRAIVKGVRDVLALKQAGPEQVSYLAHGTTVGTNALIEKKGCRLGLITTKGFKDLMEIGTQRRPSLYNLQAQKPYPLVPSGLNRTVTERVRYDGTVETPLDEEETRQGVRELKAQGVAAIAVCTLFSFINPVHELRIEEIIREEFPEAYVTISSKLAPEFREFSRMSTTVMNSYLGPVMEKYVNHFRDSIRDIGIQAEPYVTQSNGSITIQIIPNGTLGSEADCIAQIQAGALEMTKVSAGTLGNFKNEWNALSVPYVFNDKEHYYGVMDGEVAQTISQLVEEKSGMFHVLGYFKDGVRSMYTVNPVESMDDMKDLKFRIQNSPTQVAFWTELGVQPTFVAFNEIYQGLQNKVIDGAENSYSQIYQQKHYEVCKNVTETEHDVATRFFLISKAKYDAMPDDLKAVIDESAALAVTAQREADAAMNDEYKQLMMDAGVNFIQIDKTPLIEKTESVRQDAAKGMGLEDMLNTINSLKK